jgi:hypothetical protein
LADGGAVSADEGVDCLVAHVCWWSGRVSARRMTFGTEGLVPRLASGGDGEDLPRK